MFGLRFKSYWWTLLRSVFVLSGAVEYIESGRAGGCPTHLLSLVGVCFSPLSRFQVDFFAQDGILSFWLFFNPKIHIFGPTWKLNNGPKHSPSNGERCVGHFYAPSRCHSRSRLVQKWVFLGLKNSQNKQYEVPKSENLSIVWRHLSKSLVPFFFQKLIYRTPLWKPPFATSAGN